MLWDEGLIKVEIGRKGKRPCHSKAIQQFIMDGASFSLWDWMDSFGSKKLIHKLTFLRKKTLGIHLSN